MRNDSGGLAALIERRGTEIVERWMSRRRIELAYPGLAASTLSGELTLFLEALIDEFRAPHRTGGPAKAERTALAQAQGKQRQAMGVDINALVWDYAQLRDILLDVMEEHSYPLTIPEARILTRVIADAIADGVAEFARDREQRDRTLMEELRRSQQHLQGLLESAAEGIYGVDLAGRCTFANAACARLLGVAAPEQLVGVNIHELAHHTRPDGSPHPADECRIYQAFREGRAADVAEEVFWRSDGTSFPVHYHSAPILQHGEVLGAVAVFEDITLRQQMGEEIKRRAEFAEQLVGIVSHDLRTPLSAISLTAAAMAREQGSDPRYLERVGRIRSSADRATRMIRDLLDFTQARLGQGLPMKSREVDLFEILRTEVDELRTANPGRQILIAENGGGVGSWDPDRMAQVVRNLVSNAVAFSPLDTPVKVELVGEAEQVLLRVHNEGEPIPDEVRSRMFEPMVRGAHATEADVRSVGLGLYIVDRIVRQHSGRVEVRSSVEQGTTFEVIVPRRPDPHEDAGGKLVTDPRSALPGAR